MIATLKQGRLPQELFPDKHLESILQKVQTMDRKRYPDYQLDADHISQYQEMKLVTFTADREMHALVVYFPVFVKNY